MNYERMWRALKVKIERDHYPSSMFHAMEEIEATEGLRHWGVRPDGWGWPDAACGSQAGARVDDRASVNCAACISLLQYGQR